MLRSRLFSTPLEKLRNDWRGGGGVFPCVQSECQAGQEAKNHVSQILRKTRRSARNGASLSAKLIPSSFMFRSGGEGSVACGPDAVAFPVEQGPEVADNRVHVVFRHLVARGDP